MENLVEKSGEKLFLGGVWSGEGEEKNVMGLGYFSLSPQKCVLVSSSCRVFFFFFGARLSLVCAIEKEKKNFF